MSIMRCVWLYLHQSTHVCQVCCRYKYTHEDVAKMIQDKRSKGATHNVAADRMRLMNLRDHQREQGNAEEVVRYVIPPPSLNMCRWPLLL